MIKKIFKLLAALVLILVAVLLVNTFAFKSRQSDIVAVPAPPLPEGALEHFQGAIKFRTISLTDTTLVDTSQFKGFHRYLRRTYPLVHSKLSLKIVNGYSLLYTWEGTDPSLSPWVLMGHQDVVPIEEASRGLWTVDPFEGVVKDDFIWGRGATDDKVNVISVMEATEKLLRENFQPKRTIYLAFGNDEETGGRGARALAAELKSRNVNAELVIDEGGFITLEKVPGMTKPVALIGTSEKGYMSLELTVELSGGHSSMPASETALDILAKAIVRLREQPFPAQWTASMEGFITHVGPEMPFLQKMVFANKWLFNGVLTNIYEGTPGGNAVVRTTMVPTILNAGGKDNVVPTVAKAVVNFRLLPGDSSRWVIEEVRKRIADGRVLISQFGGFAAEPTGISSENGPGYKIVEQTVKKTFANTVATPFMMIGGTDSRHMEPVSKDIIKFSPVTDPIGFHGIDEHLSVDSYKGAIWFFETLLRQAN